MCQTLWACLALASFCVCVASPWLWWRTCIWPRLRPMRPAFSGWLRPAVRPALAFVLPMPWSANRRTKGFGNAFQNFVCRGLDDALHEHTAVRSELSALLAPRPFVPKTGRALASKGSGLGSGKGRQALAPQGRGHGKARGNAKGRASGRGRGSAAQSSPGSSKQEWVSSAKVDGEVKTLCVRHSQRTGCKNPSCRFAHLCPVKLPSGRICLGTHPAWQHQDTPPLRGTGLGFGAGSGTRSVFACPRLRSRKQSPALQTCNCSPLP